MTHSDTINIETYFGLHFLPRTFEKGSFLFRQGQDVDYINFIDSGRVKVETYESLVLYSAMEGNARGFRPTTGMAAWVN
jgi:CRP-like cAMP-binding protein